MLRGAGALKTLRDVTKLKLKELNDSLEFRIKKARKKILMA
jgi:hypothetical protein